MVLQAVDLALPQDAGARTKEALWTTIGDLLDAFPSDECQNYISRP